MEKDEIIAGIKEDIANALNWGKEAAENLREIGKKLDLKRLAKEKIYNLPTCHRTLKECENTLTKHFEEDNEEYYFNLSYSTGVENAKWIDDFIGKEYADVYDQFFELQEYLKILDEVYFYTQNLVTSTKQLKELEMKLSEYSKEE